MSFVLQKDFTEQGDIWPRSRSRGGCVESPEEGTEGQGASISLVMETLSGLRGLGG